MFPKGIFCTMIYNTKCWLHQLHSISKILRTFAAQIRNDIYYKMMQYSFD